MREQLTALLAATERADPILGGAAPWVALILLLVALVLVAPVERFRVKTSAGLLLMHLALVGILAWTPSDSPIQPSIRLIATALVLSSIARSSFLLFVHSFWMKRGALPLPKILRDVIQGLIFAVVFLLVLRSAGVELGSLLTTSALLTAVIGLSLQDTLGNLFAGLAIQAQRPFTVGDWVQLDGQAGHIGRVIEINWRATRVLTLERLEITFPNGAVAKSSIRNFSRPTALVRREIQVQAPYDAAPEFVRRVLLSGMDHVREVLTEPPPRVFTKEFTERGVNYVVRYFIEQFQDREVIDSAVHERMWYALQRANVALPVPRRRVELTHVETSSVEAPEQRVESMQKLLRQLSLFEALPDESIARLAAQCQRKRYASEEVIVHEGDATSEMYVIESGRVRIEVHDESGGNIQVVGSLGRGDFFGEMSLMTGEERTADVVAEGETTVVGLGRDAMQPLLDLHPELAEHMSRVLAERQVHLDAMRSIVPEQSDDNEAEKVEILRRIRRFFASRQDQ